MDAALNIRAILFCILLLLCIQGATLFFLGQPFSSTTGSLTLWHGIVQSPETSQQISDWYTYSHVIHGFLFYGLLYMLFPTLHPGVRILLALGIEVAWEIAENTPWLIEHYRQQALARGYSGDSIINSLSDSLAMLLGFVVAWRVPIIITILTGLALEFLVGFSIKDNLTLNIVNLIHQFDFINEWQVK